MNHTWKVIFFQVLLNVAMYTDSIPWLVLSYVHTFLYIVHTCPKCDLTHYGLAEFSHIYC